MPHPKFAARWTRALVSGLSGLTPDPADLDPPKIRWMPRAVMRAAGRMRSTLAPSVDDVPAGATFVLAFVLLDWLTFSYEWSRVGLTLWNPPPALSLGLLITRGLRTLPWVFIAALFAEVAVRRLSGGVTEGLVAAGTLTTGYGLLALFMTRWAGLDLLKVTPRDLGALLLIVPLGVLLIAVAHAQISVAVGALPREYGLEATLRFWIGDATGVLTTLPLILLLLRSGRSWLKELKMAGRDVGVFVAAVAGAQMLIFVTELPPSLSDETQYLYLLFPPIVWIAMRCGIAGAALGVFMIETGVFACAVVRGLSPADFQVYQLLAVFLSATGLLLGATITSGRNTEATLRAQREEMTRMNQVTAFGVMGSALAHELSQPLSSIA
ncbi:MAG: hypothetical protein FJX57_06635, partial [Alphaproteobacteria bacterium]|nr:hypothetical protein [Alphaproteobacteria bacterium]